MYNTLPFQQRSWNFHTLSKRGVEPIAEPDHEAELDSHSSHEETGLTHDQLNRARRFFIKRIADDDFLYPSEAFVMKRYVPMFWVSV